MHQSILSKICQLGIVVHDAEASAKNVCRLFGVEETHIQVVDLSKQAAPVLYQGKETLSYLKLALVQISGLEFEFIQFVDGDANSHKDFLDQYGPGLQHICVAVEDFNHAVEEMKKMRASPLIEGGNEQTGYYKYMDMRHQNGLVIEIYDATLSKLKGIEL